MMLGTIDTRHCTEGDAKNGEIFVKVSYQKNVKTTCVNYAYIRDHKFSLRSAPVKKSKNKRRSAKSKRKQPVSEQPVKQDRRSFLSRAGTIGGAALIVAGVGFWGVRTVQASIAERDLSVVGQGLPTIVQVHDTQCQTCIALQREVRAALKDVGDADLEYRVADIKTDDGIAFASRFAATHSTLLFFDAAGNLTDRMVGPNTRDRLTSAFQSHIAR